jgi:hypothetical protein
LIIQVAAIDVDILLYFPRPSVATTNIVRHL